MGRNTKHELYTAFLSLLEEMPYSAISITDIVETCNVHRNTFYYHFRDKNDMILQLLRDETQSLLKDQKSFDSIAETVQHALAFLRNHEVSFRRLYAGLDIEILDKYLYDILFHQFTLFFHNRSEGKMLQASDIHTLANTATLLVEGSLFHFFQTEEDFLGSLDRFFEEIDHLIEPAVSFVLDRIDARYRASVNGHASLL